MITCTCASVFRQSTGFVWVGYIKGKSAIPIARRFMAQTRNFTGENLGWYFVPDILMKRWCVHRHQEKRDTTS